MTLSIITVDDVGVVDIQMNSIVIGNALKTLITVVMWLIYNSRQFLLIVRSTLDDANNKYLCC